MPEKQRFKDSLFGSDVYCINSSAAREGEVFLYVRIGFVKSLGPAIIQNRSAYILFEEIGVTEIKIEFRVFYPAVTDYLFVIQYRFFVELLGLVRVVGGCVRFSEELISLVEK